MTESDGYVLLALFLVPLGSALLLMLTPSRERTAIIGLTALASLAMFVLSVYAFVRYSFVGEQFQGVLTFGWMQNVGLLGEHGLQLKVGVDGIAVSMVLLTGIVILAGTWVSWKVTDRTKDFFILLYVLVAGVYGTFVMLDLFFWFFLYELAVLPMYLLIAVWGSTRKEYGAMKLMMMLVAGSILIFTAIFAMFVELGTGSFDMTEYFAASFDPTFQKIFFPMVAVGCGTLGGLFPFHPWSPDGHAAAPTAVSMLHAGVLMKLGAFGVIRLGFQMMPEGGAFWAPALILLGITAALYGAISALRQTDLKLLTGFSSVSHMGYVFLGLGTLNVIGWNGAVLQMFAHGVMTALFFLLIGGMYDQSHDREIPNFSGMARQMPVWAIFFVIAGLASLGLPGLSGFVAELHIFIGAFRAYPVVGGLAVLTAAITATYLLRMFSSVFFGEFSTRWSALKEITWPERAGATVLAGSIVVLGLWPSPWIDRIAPTIIHTIPGVTL
ncbi:MAG: NADH-quinone oxidoreductase subunit M [Candidatus Rokubacteria bacterium]|nr:NADH-quinone oxidoreductase subunit M [Chloroflexota bacterium]MBM4441872.1 NADH-quinone oxidoreductase subunit M [Candidatus Rokubacteria bacterium]